MIIACYQGVGKTELSKKDMRYIDLESTCMRVNGVRVDNWYEVYCNFAEELSRQGYVVLIAAQEVVCRRLLSSKEEVCVCCPALNLREEWIRRLSDRYGKTHLSKDRVALECAKDHYEDDIRRITGSGFPILLIENADSCIEEVLLCSEIRCRKA